VVVDGEEGDYGMPDQVPYCRHGRGEGSESAWPRSDSSRQSSCVRGWTSLTCCGRLSARGAHTGERGAPHEVGHRLEPLEHEGTQAWTESMVIPRLK
jgi:hypothetical protein